MLEMPFYIKAIDRSPCRTGTSARTAHLAARGELKVGDNFIHESIISSLFRWRVEETMMVGNFDAIIPSIERRSCIYGNGEISIDSLDPLARGFQVTSLQTFKSRGTQERSC